MSEGIVQFYTHPHVLTNYIEFKGFTAIPWRSSTQTLRYCSRKLCKSCPWLMVTHGHHCEPCRVMCTSKKPMKLPCKLISFRNKTTVNFYWFWSRDGVESLTTQPLRNFHQPLNHKNSVDGTRVEEFGSLWKLEGKTMQVWNMYSIATDLYLEQIYIYIYIYI